VHEAGVIVSASILSFVLSSFVFFATLRTSLTKLGKIVDDRQYRQPDVSAMQQHTAGRGALPTWRWKRAARFWGGSLAALVLAFAGALWLFEGPNVDHSKKVVTSVPVAPVALEVAPEPARLSRLPPLVLLAPHEVAPAMAKLPPKVGLKPVELKPVALKPVALKAKALAPRARKALLARSPAPPAKAKAYPAVVKKPVLLAKRAPAAPRRCGPGKLARECARRG
jgi:hypothetical protein